MTFLNRGRPIFGDVGKPPEPAPEPGTDALGTAQPKTTAEYLTDLAAYVSGIRRGRDDLSAEVEAFVTAAHERAERYRTAWWSARIGRARTREVLDYVTDKGIKHQFQRDQLKAELARLHALFDEAQKSLPIEQRRLLAISRMAFGRHAEGDTLGRGEAADLAQRIVDEIGHSVTDEPALGPSFRVEIEQLKATLAEVLATFDTAKNSVTGEIIGHLAPAPIHPDNFARWRAALDRSDLPAVRAFAAKFDPREESK